MFPRVTGEAAPPSGRPDFAHGTRSNDYCGSPIRVPAGAEASTRRGYERGLVIQVIRSRCHTVGKRPARAAATAISGAYAW